MKIQSVVSIKKMPRKMRPVSINATSAFLEDKGKTRSKYWCYKTLNKNV